MHFIVVAPSYSEDSGGTIFLHELVNALNALGETAALSPMKPVYTPSRRQRMKAAIFPEKFQTAPGLNTPIAKPGDVTNKTIVVYPELVQGNPLGAKNVVRWLLYTPGVQHPYSFGPDELFVRVAPFADLPELTGGAPDMFLWKVNRTYRNENRPDRSGACFMVRKWDDGPRHAVTDNARQVDGMSHAELNEVFNQCDTFYTYDDATMYSHFAAICGCLSVVIPTGDAERTKVVENQALNKFGIAYDLSEDAFARARATQGQLLELLHERENAGLQSVKNMVELAAEKFNGDV